MEFLSFVKKPRLTNLQRLLLFQTPLGHFAYVLILVTMFLTILGYYSTTAHLMAFAMNLLDSKFLYILSIPLFQYIIVTSLIGGIMLGVKLCQLKVSSSAFLKYQLLSKAIGAIMLPYEVKTILKYLASRKLSFPVTPKSEKTLSFKETLSISRATILIMILLVIGLIWANPLGIFYNATWLLPFFISPLVIYLFSKAHNSGAAESEIGIPRTFPVGGSITVTCLYSQPETVSHLLELPTLLPSSSKVIRLAR